MKKKLLSYLILACSICGLTFVGSCKDYEIETLQEEIDNLRVETIDGTIQDQIDAIKQAIGMAGATPGTPGTSKYIEKIYKLLGDTTKLKEKSVTQNLDEIYKLLSNYYAEMKLDSAHFEDGMKLKADIAKVKADSTYFENLLGDKVGKTIYAKDLQDLYAKIKADSSYFENELGAKVDKTDYVSDIQDLYAKIKSDSVDLSKNVTDLAPVYAKIKSDSTDLANKIASIVTCACGWPDNLFITHVNTRLAADSLRLIKDSVRLFKDSVSIAKIEVRLKSDSVVLARHENRLKSDSIRLAKAENRLKKDSIRLVTDSTDIAQIKAQIKKDSIRLAKDSIQLRKDSIRLYKDSVDLSKIAKRLTADSIRLAKDSVRVYRDSVAIDSIIKSLAKIEAAHADFVGRIELRDSLRNVEKRYKKADTLIMDSVTSLANTVGLLKDSIRMIWDTIANIRTDLNNLNNKVIKLEKRVDTLEYRVDTLEFRVDTLDNRVDSLMDAEHMRITSLYIQGTENGAFGTFALPIGVRSNILMAYHDKVRGTVPAGGIYFPTQATSRMWFKDEAFTDKEKVMLAESGFTLDSDGLNLVSDEELFSDSLGNAGKIYFTINPNEVKIDTTRYAFSFRNSVGDSVKVRLNNIKPSTKQLKFGFNTRAGMSSPTGFWEADVTIDASEASALKPAINKEALVEIAKDMKKNRDISLAGVATAVLKSLDNVFDANALNVVWKDSMGEHSVTSGYDLAIATVTPLSYHTLPALLDEFELSKKRLPTNPIDELLASIDAPEVKFSFKEVKMGEVKFKLSPIVYNSTVGLTPADVTLTVTDGVNSLTGSTTIDLSDQNDKIEATIKNLMDSVNASFVGMEDSVKMLVNRIQDQIADQVNEMLNDVDSQFASAVTKVFNSVKTQIGSNKFVSKVNSLTSKLNKVLDSTNELLEVSLLYDKNDAFHPMSATRKIPSIVEGTTTLELCPTSLTADILAPAYRRFVAVTNVIDPETRKSAQKNDDTCLGVLKNANQNSINMCDVIESNVSVTFNATPGYIYEIAYSAIDYQGYISTRRFYVHVK